MSKIKEFLNKAVVDDAAKKEIKIVLGGKKLAEATDGQLAKVSEVAKKLGVDITAEEIKEFASGNMELDDEELDAVAGGFDSEGRPENAVDWYELSKEYSECMRDHIHMGYGGIDKVAAAKIVAEKHNVSYVDVQKSYEFFVLMRDLLF